MRHRFFIFSLACCILFLIAWPLSYYCCIDVMADHGRVFAIKGLLGAQWMPSTDWSFRVYKPWYIDLVARGNYFAWLRFGTLGKYSLVWAPFWFPAGVMGLLGVLAWRGRERSTGFPVEVA